MVISLLENADSDLQSLMWSLLTSFRCLTCCIRTTNKCILCTSSAQRWRTPSHYINIILMFLPIFPHLQLPKSCYSFNTGTLCGSNHIRPKATCSYSPNILWWFLDWTQMYILPQINKYYIIWPIGRPSPTNLSFRPFAFTSFTGGPLFRSLKPTPLSKPVFSR